MVNNATHPLQNIEEGDHLLQSFRFGAKFENVSSYFKKPNKPTIMASESVTCAGVQYRLLLSLENDERENSSNEPALKALLQKSKGRGPSVSYSIYLYDHRFPLDVQTPFSCNEPITICKSDGEGFANSISLATVKGETDSLFLTITLNFD